MVFSWLKRRRRNKLLAEPFPAAWEEILQRNFLDYSLLSSDEQAKLRGDVRIFVAEKNWEGCDGLAMTDEVKLSVAAQACYLLLGLEHDYFPAVLSILVYPTAYAVPERRHYGGMELVGESSRLGEAWYRGPVILSWDDVLRDGREPGGGHNLVWHEFAHQLDYLDRQSDGTPPLGSRQQYRQWREVMTAEYRQLIADAQAGRPTLLDKYGTSNEAEFFAVATECFFDLAVELEERHPHLYQLLRDYYRQDPAERQRRAGA
jgi:Mlc titration factor MtfA (ptsG expression regulator)